MPVTFVIRFEVVPEKLGQFSDLLYETWESLEDVTAVQLLRPYRKAWHDALPELLREPRDVTIWQPIRADRKQREAKMREPRRPT